MKIIDKIKEYLTKGITIKPKVAIITAVVSAVSMCVSYAGGGIYKLDNLVMQEAQSQIEELKQSDNEITSEIKELSDKKENLNNTLNSKADVQKAIDEYNASKTDYNNQISQLNNDITSLDSDIQSNQKELDEKKAAAEKAAAEKAAAEKAAQEKAAAEAKANAVSQNDNQSYTVYITNTGSKYHSNGCQYLKKSKIARVNFKYCVNLHYGVE
jgi:septal ring factor EnvC (AmiA/AmiB activator)